MARVSVQIVTYNSRHVIESCLLSVRNQTITVDQIVVVDNDSKDGTREYLENLSDDIEVIYNGVNRGFSVAHNQAIQATHMDYVLVLNPDVTLAPNYLEHLITFLESNPSYGSATGRLMFTHNPTIVDSTGLVMTRTRRAFDRGANTSEDQWLQNTEIFGVSGAAALYRRTMIEDISVDNEFFDNTFFAYKEDVDVAWRAQLFGWQTIYLCGTVANHVRGWKMGTRYQTPLRVRRHSYINRYRMLLKNETIYGAFRDGVFMFAFECSSFLYVLLREPMILVSWMDLMRDFTILLHRRRIIQKRRVSNLSTVYKFIK